MYPSVDPDELIGTDGIDADNVADHLLHVLDRGLVLGGVPGLTNTLQCIGELTQCGILWSVPGQHRDAVDGLKEATASLDDVGSSVDDRRVARTLGPIDHALGGVAILE